MEDKIDFQAVRNFQVIRLYNPIGLIIYISKNLNVLSTLRFKGSMVLEKLECFIHIKISRQYGTVVPVKEYS